MRYCRRAMEEEVKKEAYGKSSFKQVIFSVDSDAHSETNWEPLQQPCRQQSAPPELKSDWALKRNRHLQWGR